MSKKNPRDIIFDTLYAFFSDKKSLKILITKYIKDETSYTDKAFILNIVKGVVRDKRILDENIYQYSKFKKIDARTLTLLYIGTYQLLFCDSVPDYASINTTVELSKRKHKKSFNFINAILRKISKSALKKTDQLKTNRPEIYFSYPDWILNKIRRLYDNKLYSICESSSNIPPIWIRINAFKTNLAELSQILIKNNISFSEDKLLSNYIKIDKFDSKNIILDLIKKGFIYIQNPSSGLVVNLLSPSKNDTILDACSAPGGKAAFIAELNGGGANLTCLDINKKRINQIKSNFSIMGIKDTSFICEDSIRFRANKKYNKILLDLPCSSSGTIRKNPDIKWTLSKNSLKNIQKTQYDILNNMKNNLAKKGEIIYSTCSIFNDENHKNIERFIAENDDFHISKINNKNIPENFINELGGITILPDENGYEGMFAIKIKKNV